MGITQRTQDVYVENPKRGKPQESTNSELSLCEKGIQMDVQRQQPLAHSPRLAAVTTENTLYLAPSLSIYLTIFCTTVTGK